MKPLLNIGSIIRTVIFCCITTSCQKQDSPGNPPIIQSTKFPVARAGPDQSIALPVTLINLDGSGSTSPDNGILTFVWKKIDGPYYYVFFSGSQNTASLQVECYAVGVFQFELSVTNSVGLVSRDTVKITVNHSPATEHRVDIVFDINSICQIQGSFPGVIYSEANFLLSANSNTNLPGGNQPLTASINQYFENWATYYFGDAQFIVSDSIGYNQVMIEFNSMLNFFTLPYNNGSTTFSDSVHINYGRGRFANIYPGTLFCSGLADTTSQLGKIRLQGSLYY